MPINVKKIFGENVRNYRRKQNLTQEKLAELIDVSPKHLGVIERGDAFVSAELLEKTFRNTAYPCFHPFLYGRRKHRQRIFPKEV
ncbi:MAG: helix-turn-helix transcriptional regulator [Treponema sp.]|nr:helix-turn-helix transcriptional regulator [Treponema sp.]